MLRRATTAPVNLVAPQKRSAISFVPLRTKKGPFRDRPSLGLKTAADAVTDEPSTDPREVQHGGSQKGHA